MLSDINVCQILESETKLEGDKGEVVSMQDQTPPRSFVLYIGGLYVCSELQIRRDVEDNSKIIFLISELKKYVVTSHQSCLDEMVLMMGHKIYFYGEIWLIIP